MSERRILRYTLAERVVHWLAAAVYLYVLATGLAFWSPSLYWIATALGGGAAARFWHPVAGVAFTGTLLWMWRAWRVDLRVTAEDREWGAQMARYVRNEDAGLPPIGRFNVGQKYFFRAMAVAGGVLLVTGLVMWLPAARELRLASILLHAAAALVTVGAFIVHVYMGTAVVRGGFTSIVRGEVSTTWARQHHRLWHDRISGE